MKPEPWSKRIVGSWMATPSARVRHIYGSSRYGLHFPKCATRALLRAEIVNGERYNALEPCRRCMDVVREEIAWREGLLAQQGQT